VATRALRADRSTAVPFGQPPSHGDRNDLTGDEDRRGRVDFEVEPPTEEAQD
jgi:hypothetical protein